MSPTHTNPQAPLQTPRAGTCDICSRPAIASRTGPRRLCDLHERITQPGIVWGVRRVPAKP